MFLYACLLLLPTTALAQCGPGTAVIVFKVFDTDEDGYIEPTEANDFVRQADVNGDKILTLEEGLETIPSFAPELTGRVEELIEFYDANNDGVITAYDVKAAFYQIDANKDGHNAREEFDAYIARVC